MDRDSEGKGTEETDAFGRGRKQMEGHPPQVLDYVMFTCPLWLRCVQLFATSRTVALQSPVSMGFPRQEYWSGLPFPTPGDLPKPGIKPVSLVSPALGGWFFTTKPDWLWPSPLVVQLQKPDVAARTAFKDVRALIPRSSQYTVSHSKRDFCRCDCVKEPEVPWLGIFGQQQSIAEG